MEEHGFVFKYTMKLRYETQYTRLYRVKLPRQTCPSGVFSHRSKQPFQAVCETDVASVLVTLYQTSFYDYRLDITKGTAHRGLSAANQKGADVYQR